MQELWPQLLRVTLPAPLSPKYRLPCSALFLGGGGWQREGVGESLCFAVAVATVVSLVAGAHVSCSQPECELVACKQISSFRLLEKSHPLPFPPHPSSQSPGGAAEAAAEAQGGPRAEPKRCCCLSCFCTTQSLSTSSRPSAAPPCSLTRTTCLSLIQS